MNKGRLKVYPYSRLESHSIYFLDLLPRHALLDGGAVGVLAEGSPLHLAVGDRGDFPPLAQFVLALVLPYSGEQRAVDEVV